MLFRTTRSSFLISAAAVFAGAAVGLPAVRFAAGQDGAYSELVMVATDYAFDMPEAAESGYIRLTLDNQGQEDHHAILFRINDDATVEQFQEALISGDLGAVLGVSSAYGGPNVGPSHQSSVVAYLDAGQYAVVCVIPDPSGVPHVAHGMMSMLEVIEGAGDMEAPATDMTINLVDMAFDGLPAQVAAGPQTWEIMNIGGQLHELVVMQLAPGVTPEGLLVMLTGEGGAATPPSEPNATPMTDPPAIAVAGTAPKSPGATNYLELDLEPGEYVAICLIPDTETGVPHFAMGMIAGFTVA